MVEDQGSRKSMKLGAVHARGLACALLLSLVVHAFWLTKPSQWLPFSEVKTPQAAWTTRLIPTEPAALRSVPQAPPSQKSLAQTQPIVKPPVSSLNSNENQPLAQINPALSAIETIVNSPEPAPANPPAEQPPVVSNAGEATSSSGVAVEQVRLEYPGNVALSYEGVFSRQGVQRKGVGQLQWKSDGAAYEMSLQASYFGITLLSQSSVGSLSDRGLEPLRYGDRRGVRSEQAAHFRREKAQVEFSNNKPAAALLPGAQDRLSVIMQLAALLMGDVERHLVAKRIVMQVAGIDDAQVWEFVIEGAEPVTLPTGQVQALRLQRKPRDEFDQRLEIWLAAEFGYLPVRIKQTSVTSPHKDFTDLVLSKLP